MKDELDLLSTEKRHKGFFKLLLSFKVCVTRHAQITQNNNFPISLQYHKKELSHEVDFLHADKHESLLQIDSMILMVMVKHSQGSQNNKFAMSLQYLKREDRNGSYFRRADKRQSFYKLLLSFLMEVARHVQNTQNRKLVIFLQYIKKNCRNWVLFYCDANHSDILGGPFMFIVTWLILKHFQILKSFEHLKM